MVTILFSKFIIIKAYCLFDVVTFRCRLVLYYSISLYKSILFLTFYIMFFIKGPIYYIYTYNLIF